MTSQFVFTAPSQHLPVQCTTHRFSAQNKSLLPQQCIENVSTNRLPSGRAHIVLAPLLILTQPCLDYTSRATLYHLMQEAGSVLPVFPVHLTTRSQPMLFFKPFTHSRISNYQFRSDRVSQLFHCSNVFASQFKFHLSVRTTAQPGCNPQRDSVSFGLHLLHTSCPHVCRQDFDSLAVGVCFAGTTL